MGKPFAYGSVCSGIEAATVAWHPLGWKPSFFSEIDAFPRAVLAHHYPEVPLHGDFTTIKAGQYEPIDLLVGGTPCQSFSVAGLRGGLDDERGNLALEYLRLAQRLRPRWLVWENVPGVLSSNGGRDFGAILGGMVELGYGVAYRVLDAQFFGVAQRRRRVFAVGYLGDWRRAAAVLFERHGLSGHPAPRREAREGVAPCLASGAVGSNGGGIGRDGDPAFTLSTDSAAAVAYGVHPDTERAAAGTLNANGKAAGSATQQDAEQGLLVTHSLRGEGFDASEDGTGRGTPIIPVHAFDARQSDVIQYGDMTGPLDTDGHTMAICFSAKDHGADAMADLSPTLRAGGHSKSHANAGVMPAVAFSVMPQNSGKDYKAKPTEVAQPIMAGGPVGGDQGGDYIVQAVPFDTTQVTSAANYSNPQPGDPCHPLARGAHAPAIAFAIRGREGGAMPELGGEQTGALRAASGGSSRDYVAFAPEVSATMAARSSRGGGQINSPGHNADQQVVVTSAVRRLTPRECERLQGFPDDYTQIPYRKGEAADGPRYKALGNSMAVPCMAWIGQRIAAVEALQSSKAAA